MAGNLVCLPTSPDPGTEKVFGEVFGMPAANAQGWQLPALAVQHANAYVEYVRKLASSLQQESLRLTQNTQDVGTLVQAVTELVHLESGRRQALAPFLAAGKPDASGVQKSDLGKIQNQLRQVMASELEAIRDARLRLEFRKAELINQQAGFKARIVIRGAAQVRLHFGKSADHAAKKA
jgi:hypothetical protein